jgi:RecA/RadA recombinase
MPALTVPAPFPRGRTGGFTTGEMTELAGPSGTGKTQICLAAAVNVAR